MSTKCVWCGKVRKTMSRWEQQRSSGEYAPLCNPCAKRRLDNPWNALLPMRKVEKVFSGDSSGM